MRVRKVERKRGCGRVGKGRKIAGEIREEKK